MGLSGILNRLVEIWVELPYINKVAKRLSRKIFIKCVFLYDFAGALHSAPSLATAIQPTPTFIHTFNCS